MCVCGERLRERRMPFFFFFFKQLQSQERQHHFWVSVIFVFITTDTVEMRGRACVRVCVFANLPLAITHDLYDQSYALSAIPSSVSRSYLASGTWSQTRCDRWKGYVLHIGEIAHTVVILLLLFESTWSTSANNNLWVGLILWIAYYFGSVMTDLTGPGHFSC